MSSLPKTIIMNLKNLKSNFVSGLGVTLIASLQAIILAPILISTVGSTMYGAWIVLADVFVALQIFDFGITAYSAQRIAQARANNLPKTQTAHFFASITIVVTLIAILNLITLSTLHYFRFPVALSYQEISTIRECAAIGIASVSVQLLNYTLVAPSRALERMRVVNVVTLLGAIAGLLITLGLLYLDYGLYAAAYGMLARSVMNLTGGLISAYAFKDITSIKNLDSHKYTAALTDQLRNAPVTFLGNFSSIALSSSDGFLVSYFSGLQAVAVYSISKKLFDFVKTVVDVFTYSSYGGLASAVAKLPLSRSIAFKHRYILVALFLSASLCIGAYSIVDIFVKYWVDSSHYIGNYGALLIALGALLASFSNFLFSLLRACGMFGNATMSILSEIVLKLLLSAVLIPVIGLNGMPVSIIFSAAIGSTISLAVLNPRLTFQGWFKYRWMVIGVLVALFFSAISNLIDGYEMVYFMKIAALIISANVLRVAYSLLKHNDIEA